MQAIIDMPTLKKALMTARPAVMKRSGSSLALSGAHISAEGDTVVITASDLDLSISVSVPGTVTVPGTALVPFSLLADTVKKGKGLIELAVDGEELTATNGITRRIRALPLDEYPKIPGVPATNRMLLDLAALATVVPAASKDDARPILTGLYFNENEIAATDSYRLHVVRFPESVQWPQVLVPARAFGGPLKFNKTTAMAIDDRVVGLQAGNVAWRSRRIEGDFPNYRQLIPASYPNQVLVQRAELIAAIEQVATMARDAAPVRLRFADGMIVVSATTQGVGSAEAGVRASYNGPQLEIGLNPVFVVDALRVGVGDEVSIEFLDNLKPVVFTDTTPGPWKSIRLLMPVRLS